LNFIAVRKINQEYPENKNSFGSRSKKS